MSIDMTPAQVALRATPGDGAHHLDESVLAEVERKVLWLATSIVHHANVVRPNPSGLKVGGHQASSASMVSIMTTLWFKHLRREDRVSVKPHASPVLHSINYLLGELDAGKLTTLREFGGLQSYPSRIKDPDTVDYATGSVGIGATAPIWGSITRRYVQSAFGTGGIGRQYSLVGDAELDEGAVWEAVLDPMVAELGEIVWIVDLNRQSLDRVVPGIATHKLARMFEAAGWQVLTVKYGSLIERMFARPGGESLRARIDEMPNPEYQRLLRLDPAELVKRIAARGGEVATFVASVDPGELWHAIRNLGGHDLSALDRALGAIDDSRPTVIFAYTVKGYGLPTEGHPQNHSALLNAEQYAALGESLHEDPADPWRRFAEESAAGRLLSEVGQRLHRTDPPSRAVASIPSEVGRSPAGLANTQAALGRALLDLSRQAPEVARRIVTVAPDVSSSTNLGGWVNKVGVWSIAERANWFADDAETILHWREAPTGQHIELGIAETNLVCLLSELGLSWSRWGEPLLPIGVVYDPFVARALEPWSFGMYAGGQSILVGTPSGVTLAPEGGAHQSITSPSIGLEQPSCVYFEPAFAVEVEWMLLDSLSRLGRPGGSSSYLRLSTRPVAQDLAEIPRDPAARERRRRQVVAGGYLLRRAAEPGVTLAAMGAVVPQALLAAGRLAEMGLESDVVCVTSPDLLHRAVRARDGQEDAPTWILDQVFPRERARPMVTALDGHPHTLGFLGGVQGVRTSALGVTRFGQSGSLDEVYRYHQLDADSIVRAALDVIR
jgi:pyruvate dehydrogenase E1 component